MTFVECTRHIDWSLTKFAWEQAAEEYGRLVAEWVSSGYRRVIVGRS